MYVTSKLACAAATGQLSRDFATGEIEIRTKNNVTEIEFDARGGERKARIPASFFGEVPKSDSEYHVVVRGVDVKNVRMLAASCGAR